MRRSLAALALIAAACGSHDPASPAAEPAGANSRAPAAQTNAAPAALVAIKPPDPSLPVTKRILGKWRMDIARTPDTALTPEFLKLKRSGKAASMLITYTITDTDFTMEAFGAKSIWHHRFDYEILKEEDNTLLLKKTDDQGKSSEIGVMLKPNDELVIGTGNGQVPLYRVGPPEHVR
jgi:hypothetical protein